MPKVPEVGAKYSRTAAAGQGSEDGVDSFVGNRCRYVRAFNTFGHPACIRSMTKVYRSVLATLAILAPFAMDLMAQPVGGPPPCWPPPCIPIDGGVGALIAAGVLFGGRKALELRRSRKPHA